MKLEHFILTRFNIQIWSRDKYQQSVRSEGWLEQRFMLFEKFCLPSILGQTNKEFEWIVLFDTETPERFKEKIKDYKLICPQFLPLFVKPEHGKYFCQIFKNEVSKRMTGQYILTTYLDNDDALNKDFIENLHNKANEIDSKAFICYSDGFQYFTDSNLLFEIHYPTNHFISLLEKGNRETLKTVYGYGSHAYINKIPGLKIVYIPDSPQWCEVIHERNMVNDAYFLSGIKMIRDKKILKDKFSIDESVNYGIGLYLFRFMPRYIKTFFRRIKYFVFGRKW